MTRFNDITYHLSSSIVTMRFLDDCPLRYARFKKFLHNSEKGTYLGRSRKSWVPTNEPYRVGQQSILRDGPGISLAISTDKIKNYMKIGVSVEEVLNEKYNGTSPPYQFPLAELKTCIDCAYLKVNKIINWYPDTENGTKEIQISCEPKNDKDGATLGKIEYIPSGGGGEYGTISTDSFPFVEMDGYVTPLLGLKFPNIQSGKQATVKCKIINLKNVLDFVLNFAIEK